MKKHLAVFLGTLIIAAGCSESQPPQQSSAGASASAAATPVSIAAPAGKYRDDPAHSGLLFSVRHLGLSNYVMRFEKFDVEATLVPDNLAQSSVEVKIDSTSVSTDYHGDYKAAHKDSPYDGWEEELVQSPKFLNAGEYPTITYRSTSVKPTDKGRLRIDGELTLLGTTKPVTLEAEVVGSKQAHPFMGVGAIAFSATGSFRRSDFGMTHLLEPPLVSDEVSVRFEGELLQVVEQSEGAGESATESAE